MPLCLSDLALLTVILKVHAECIVYADIDEIVSTHLLKHTIAIKLLETD